MIAQLSGRLIHKTPEFSIIDVSGVGYQVYTPFSTFYELPDIENQVTLHTYTNVREDALQLFGFLTTDEKEIFQLLIGVSGIGPKLAVNILSGITPGGKGTHIFFYEEGKGEETVCIPFYSLSACPFEN